MRDALALRREALADYGRGGYVRALRSATRAARTIPTDLRLRLLMGLIYDSGFERPDLAAVEYRHALDLDGGEGLRDRLRRRIHLLTRRTYESAFREAEGSPFTENWLAVYPLVPSGPRPPEEGMGLALLDQLLPVLRERSNSLHIDDFRIHILGRAYRQTHPSEGPEAFARWSGAGQTLTGTLSDLGARRVRVVLRTLDAQGHVVHETAPIDGTLDAPGALFEALAPRALAALDLPADAPPVDIPSPVAFALYARGLSDYVAGRIDPGRRHLHDASVLDPTSRLIARTRGWADDEHSAEAGGVASLLADYRRLLRLPDPGKAAERRLRASQALIDPPSGVETGVESLDPYNPPRPEAAP